ncbi:MAG: AMP-binding protein [Thermomicrobiales bacterium]|nr:AMP-binding protein [Thermomicrobiales bacterium]
MSDAPRLPEAIAPIPAALDFWAARAPDALALLAPTGETWSYRELRNAVARTAQRLLAAGMRPGEPVALLLQGSAAACIALLAAGVAGAAVPLNPRSTAAELRRDLGRLGAPILMTGGPTTLVGQDAAAAVGMAALDVDELVRGAPRDAAALGPLPTVDPEQIVAILHTSGTTGWPKRVLRSHRSYVATARATRICTNLTPDDRLLVSSGIFTNGGFGAICAALCTGGSCVLTPAFDPAAYPAWLEALQPTWAITTPTELNLLLGEAERTGRGAISGPRSRLRALRVGAQPMTPGTLERAEESLRATILESYGMTEASYITASGPGVRDRRAGASGKPLGCAVRVIGDDGRDLPAGQPGAITIRGATLFSGYLDDPEANAAAFLPGGWFRTGDIGVLDEAGYLHLRGRANELINRGGEKIAPAEVDRALLSHPAVAEAATFAVPDDRLGEDIVAAVVPRAGLSPSARELRGWLLDQLSPAKVPRRVWFVERLPRTASGKVQRRELARRWQEAFLPPKAE